MLLEWLIYDKCSSSVRSVTRLASHSEMLQSNHCSFVIKPFGAPPNKLNFGMIGLTCYHTPQ